MTFDKRSMASSSEMPNKHPLDIDSLFKAISDPKRRHILEQIKGSPMTVNQIADHFPISRPAVSQHLRALRDAQLVSVKKRGTNRIYMFNDTGFLQLQAWIDAFGC